MKKYYFLIIVTLILGLVLTGCSLLSNIGQAPATNQSGITYLTKNGPLSDIVGLWHFDEGEGTDASDSSGNCNNGTLVNGPMWEVDGKFGNALSFDGANDYVEIVNNTGLNITQGTWEAWIKFDVLPSVAGHPMNPLAKANQYWIHGSRNDPDSGTTDAIVVKICVSGKRYCATTDSDFIEVDVWYHVAGTYDGETLKLYVNGALVDSNIAPSGNIDIGTQIMAVGTWSALIDYFQGTIDEVRIWNFALSQDQLGKVYDFEGFFRPIDIDSSVFNVVKAGRAIPVKFSLDGYQGLDMDNIFVPGYPKSILTKCPDADDEPDDEMEFAETAGESSLSYDATDGQYTYVWKTEKDWTGCRQLIVKLIDGTYHIANFTFK